MVDRSVRSLVHLQESASTARVLNLLRTHKRWHKTPEHAEAPFFKHPLLNRSILIKHRLRRNEQELFGAAKQTATKVIIPVDGSDLRVGGRSIFVGQQGYEMAMAELLGDHWAQDTADHEMLRYVDEIPSLDPFLLREQLKRNDRNPARCYFEISDADMQRMFAFVEREITKLVDLCYQGQASAGGQSAILVKKILGDAEDATTEPLRLTLRLEKKQYREGVFCWKGFLYYKWTLAQVLPDVSHVATAIAEIKPRGTMSNETKVTIAKSRESLGRSILLLCDSAKKRLKIYDDAFANLLNGQPTAFRDFLLSAPDMFTDLGERLGAVNHIVSFWRFRFPSGRQPVVSPEELLDIFSDFEGSLGFPELAGARAKAA